MKKIVILLASLGLLASSGCAVNRAFNKPSPKDLSFLAINEGRDTVRAELGSFTASSDSAQCDVHAFVEGSGGLKYLRGVTYSLFDLATLGFTEIFFNPIEAAIGNDNIRLRTCYNTANMLQQVHRLDKHSTATLLSAPAPVVEATPVALPVALPVASPAKAPAPATSTAELPSK